MFAFGGGIGSMEEEQEVLKQYTIHKGNMNHILSYVPHSKASDVPRFMILVKNALEANTVQSFPSYARTTTKSAQLRRTRREAKEAKQLERQNRNDGDETHAAATVEQQRDGRAPPEITVDTTDAQTSTELAANLASIVESAINQDLQPEPGSSTVWPHYDPQAKDHEEHKDGAGTSKPPSPPQDTKGKKPVTPSKATTVTPSHDNDTTQDKAPKRRITTRSMTRTRDQQKETTAKSARGSSTSTISTTTTTTTTELTVLATTEKDASPKVSKRGDPIKTDNIGESSRATKKKKSSLASESSQQTRSLRPRNKGANKS